jgi:hypothetical protein
MAMHRKYAAVSNKAWRQMEFWLYGSPVLEHNEMSRSHMLKAFASLGQASVVGEMWTMSILLIIPWN